MPKPAAIVGSSHVPKSTAVEAVDVGAAAAAAAATDEVVVVTALQTFLAAWEVAVLALAATEAEAGAGAGAAAPTEAKSDYYKYNFKDFGNIQLCQKQHSKHQLVHPQQLQHSQQQKPAQQ